MKNEKLITILLTLYIILFPIKVLVLPYIGNKLQLADGLFLVLLLITVIQLPQIKQIRLLNFDKAIIFWLLAHIITCLFHPTKASVIELVGTTYLVILYGCLNILFISKNKDEIRETFFHGFGLSALLLMFLGFLGTIGISFGYPNICVFKHDNYPYFGTVYRMSGLTTHPVMFASIAGICFLLIVTEFNIKKAIEVATWKK